MPKNNGLKRRAEREEDARRRRDTYDMEYGPVAEREAKRGYPAKLDAQKAELARGAADANLG